ncbi:hypothetical protein GR160_07570 [Flavobacterium sp. Sd200]|nr:hypothetical protein [Flavobacterium sp. Sd200]
MMLLDTASRNILISGNNFIVLLVYSLIELVFFVYFYSRFMLNKPNKIIIGLGAVAAVYIVAEIVQYFANPMYIKQFQPYAKVVDNFVIIIMALAFFYQKMRSFNETRWGNFKLNTVLLIFFTLNTIIFLPFNFLVNDSSGVVFYIWTANGLAISFFYLYLFSLIFKNGKTALAYS